MIHIVYTPKWFYGEDIAIDLLSSLVLAVIAFFAIRYYNIDRKKNYLYLALSFLAIAFSFLFKIATNFTVYYMVHETRELGQYTLVSSTVRTTNAMFFFSFLLYRLLTLLGLYALYSVYEKNQSTSTKIMTVFFILVSTYFSESSYYIFHLTAFMLLAIITVHYFLHYRKNRQQTSKFLAISFALICISQIFSIFFEWNRVLYVVAEMIQLVGYLVLMFTFVKVLRNAKKKEQARYNH